MNTVRRRFTKKKQPARKLSGTISAPAEFTHKAHVDCDLVWRSDADVDPEEMFEIIEQIGEGTFSQVFKVRHKDSTMIMAAKVVALDEHNVEEREETAREMEILYQCRHPCIMSYYGCYRSPTSVWIMTELCGGGSLEDVMDRRQKPFEEIEIAGILEPCLQGLAYLHSLDVLHRDIKGGNILITSSGEIKLADFGVSVMMTHERTAGECVQGTPHFIAPEVVNGVRTLGLDRVKADIWSLGITAIELADGEPPHAADDPVPAMMKTAALTAPPTVQDPKSWSDAYNDFVRVCLAIDFQARPTAEELLVHPLFKNKKKHTKAVVALVQDVRIQEKEALHQEIRERRLSPKLG